MVLLANWSWIGLRWAVHVCFSSIFFNPSGWKWQSSLCQPAAVFMVFEHWQALASRSCTVGSGAFCFLLEPKFCFKYSTVASRCNAKSFSSAFAFLSAISCLILAAAAAANGSGVPACRVVKHVPNTLPHRGQFGKQLASLWPFFAYSFVKIVIGFGRDTVGSKTCIYRWFL